MLAAVLFFAALTIPVFVVTMAFERIPDIADWVRERKERRRERDEAANREWERSQAELRTLARQIWPEPHHQTDKPMVVRVEGES